MRTGALILALAACGSDEHRAYDAAEPPPDGEPDYPPANGVDLLFLIDTTAHEYMQDEIGSSFAVLLAELERLHGGRPRLHVGIITQDLGAGGWPISYCEGEGDRGVLQTNACAGIDGLFLRDVAGTTNYEGAIESVFDCMAQLGITGCGFERPLDSLMRALDPATVENAGFLRDDAALAVVIVHDEDDCSTLDTALFDPSDAATDELGPLGFRCFEHGVICDPDEPRTLGIKQGCVPRIGRFFGDPRDVARRLIDVKQPGWLRVLVLAGPPEPVEVFEPEGLALQASCRGDLGGAHPGIRLAAFTDELGSRASAAPVCHDYDAALRAFAAEISEMLD